MGCDIGYRVERRTPAGWERAPTRLDLYRSYALFGALAGVRNMDNLAPISEPRGLPPDVSDEVRQYVEDAGCHSASWVTLDDLRAYDLDRVAPDRGGEMLSAGEQIGDAFEAIIEAMEPWEADGVRLVFWFSS